MKRGQDAPGAERQPPRGHARPAPPARDQLPRVPRAAWGEGRGVTPRRPSPPTTANRPRPRPTHYALLRVLGLRDNRGRAARFARRRRPGWALAAAGSPVQLRAVLVAAAAAAAATAAALGPLALPARGAAAPPRPRARSAVARTRLLPGRPLLPGHGRGLRRHGRTMHTGWRRGGGGERGAAWAAPPAAPSPLPTPRTTRGPPSPQPGPKHLRARAERGTFVGPLPGPRCPTLAPSAFFFFIDFEQWDLCLSPIKPRGSAFLPLLIHSVPHPPLPQRFGFFLNLSRWGGGREEKKKRKKKLSQTLQTGP